MPKPIDVQGVTVVNKALAKASASMLADVKQQIEVTLRDAVLHAQAGHGPGAHALGRFQSRFTHLVPSIKANEVVEVPGQIIEGSFSAGQEYAVFVEKGTKPSERTSSKGRTFTHPGSRAYPFMFPAAMAVAGIFKRRIAKALTR